MRSRLMLTAQHRVAAGLVCALAAHAAMYGSFMPADGVHGYLAWYEPIVAGLSIASFAGLGVLLVLALAGRRRGWFAGEIASPPPLRVGIARSAAWGLVILVVQESVERSVQGGSPSVALFAPSTWLVILAALAAAAAVLTFALRLAHVAVVRVLRQPARPAPSAARAWSVVTAACRRARPLAVRSALRAPPLVSPS